MLHFIANNLKIKVMDTKKFERNVKKRSYYQKNLQNKIIIIVMYNNKECQVQYINKK